MFELMDDARVVRKLNDVMDVIDEEMTWLSQLSPAVFAKLGSAISISGPELRHMCLSKSHSAIAFWRFRVANTALSRPWSLARGNIEHNLVELRAEDHFPADDPVTAKIKQLLAIG